MEEKKMQKDAEQKKTEQKTEPKKEEKEIVDKKDNAPAEAKDNTQEQVKDSTAQVQEKKVQEKIGIIGRKLGLTQIFDADGNVISVSVVKIYPGTIVQVKTVEKDGYNALKIGFEEIQDVKLNKPLLGIFKNNNLKSFRVLKEFKFSNMGNYKPGDQLNIDQFAAGDIIDITGVSKAKGFQGVVKTYNFKGGPKTRGQSDRWRAPGSIGSGTWPGKVWKGHRMGKRLGGDRVTVQSLKVAAVENDKNIMLIKGSIPGPKGSIVIIKNSIKKGMI